MRRLVRFLGQQEYLRWGLRLRLVHLFSRPDTAKAEHFTVNFFGAKYPGEFSCHVDWHVFFFGAYGREELKFIRDILSLIDDPITLDIGANVGHHTLFASMHSKEVIAFEPYPAVARKIQEKIDVNDIRNITLCPVGLGEKDATLPFEEPNSSNLGTGSFLLSSGPSSARSSTELRVVNGDAYLSAMHVPKIDFIKIDIEGFEVYALRGLRQTLRESRPVILMEWSSEAQKTLEEDDFTGLFPRNYVFYQFEENVPVLYFFRKLNYELIPLQGNPPPDRQSRGIRSYNYIVAMPIESVERFATYLPALRHS